jgi:hypothetical protein
MTSGHGAGKLLAEAAIPLYGRAALPGPMNTER